MTHLCHFRPQQVTAGRTMHDDQSQRTTLSGIALTTREEGRKAVPELMTGTARVVLVDDHDLLAESLWRALDAESDLGVVGLAASVRTACDVVRELHPEVVVMDYQLPDGTGAEATAMIKAELPETHVVIATQLALVPLSPDEEVAHG
jgi:PleD family two-component response regulator